MGVPGGASVVTCKLWLSNPMNLFLLQAWCWEELRMSATRFLFDTNIKYYLFKMFFFTESSKVARVEQLGIKITRMYVFICDSCRSQRVKVASHLLMAEACARLFSSSGNTSSVCVCVRASARVRAHTRVPLHPPTQPLLLWLFCFVSFPSSHSQLRKQTLTLSVLLDLPSVPGGQVGGITWCRNVRPPPGSLASISSHY